MLLKRGLPTTRTVIYPAAPAHRTLMRMAQPTAVLLATPEQAADAARALQTPTDVRNFVALHSESAAVREFLRTGEWEAIKARIMGDGKPPTNAPRSLADIVRLFRWNADGSVGRVPDPAAAKAYLHCARELEAYDRRQRRGGPTSPAPSPNPPEAAVPAGLSFAEALQAVKAGQHITRRSWRSWAGDTYVAAQAGYPHGIAVNANTARATGLPEGATAAFPPYLIRLQPAADAGAPPVFLPWTPDQADLFAEDWVILPRG